MLRDPIEFGKLTIARASRSARGIAHSISAARKSQLEISAANVDEAFANFTPAANESKPADWQSATRTLIADIAVQLETLDAQRRQLARLLDSADAATR
jgi:hypothetical protein